MPSAIIGLGANLGHARATLAAAVAALAQWPTTQLASVSALYRSAPVDACGPDYLNAAALVHTALEPAQMLGALHTIEAAHHRQRPYRNAPRTLDLDLILWDAGENLAQNPSQNLSVPFDSVIQNPPSLIIPHPRWKMRAFVLYPVRDIAPHIIHAQTIQNVQHQAIERIENSGWHLN